MAENLTRNFLSSRDKERKKIMSIFKLKLTPATSRLELENQMISTSVFVRSEIFALVCYSTVRCPALKLRG